MAKVEVEMPQMGESVMEGTVIEWAKSVGDQVEEDETLLEIATDKVDTEVPSPQAGKLVEILAEVDETVEVGQAIAVIETDGEAETRDGKEAETAGTGEEDVAEEQGNEETGNGKRETGNGKRETGDRKKQPEQSAAETSTGGGDEGLPDEASAQSEEKVEVKMPKMGESVMEGTVIEWAKDVGDKIEEDETLLEISTDKVDTEVPSPQSGTLVERLVEADETVEVGQTIAVIATGKVSAGEALAEEKTESKEQEQTTDGKRQAGGEEEQGEAVSTPSKNGTEPQRIGSDGRFFSPLVRSIAKEEGISQEELEGIEGSGQGGRVAKQDILNYLEDRKKGGGEAEPAKEKPKEKASPPKKKKEEVSAGELSVERPKENVEVVKMDRMRKMIAEHMVNSKHTSAHVTTFAEVDVTNLVKWRESNKAKFQDREGVKLTFTPLFIEHIIQAMREYPLVNSSVDMENSEIHLKRDINFGLAVALGDDGEGGLIVPVIKQAQDLNLAGLAKEVKSLAQKARSKNLSPDDLAGGTITLTNYGSTGNLMGTPIINQPQVAIIGTGAIQKKPVVMETDQGDVIAIRQMMYLSLSYDHRIIDGAHGGAFLSRVKELLQDFDPERDV